MSEFTLNQMQEMQKELQERYKESWGGLYPEKGRDQLLWLLIEAGEIADVIKKDGDKKIMGDTLVRQHFMEEMCDVLMYFNDVMLCYDITPEELMRVYLEKHDRNMKRW